MFYRIIRIIAKIFIWPLYRVHVVGYENIPADNYILCANHKSGFDPIFLVIAFPPQIKFMAKKELFENKFFAWLLKGLGVFPVDRKGRDLASLKNSISLLKEGKTLGIFPEGTRTKNISRENMKDGVAYIALKAKKDILPVEIVSTYKPFRKTYIYINQPINVDKYLSMKSKEAMVKMTDEVFLNIYQTQLR
ncbi:lysophospholipid acyltransferase family protein [Anaerococcus sp. DFU013_CI05]|uniref:lysophospholipid acyltransferase family protein n=1 Tax=unclassified Anaerococcus TaxID=2614126 RepID=UPI001932C2F9|nr:lysophospholipid acyltransferase family protein [Anaerococcus sp. mt242]MBM0046376.1 1-acyl-sn-glycerol-3-phosphate acyltransferase [Anaerococcus sp. mt242]